MRLRAAFSIKSGWDDLEAANKAIEWFISIIKNKQLLCPDYDGNLCTKIAEHVECEVYLNLRLELESGFPRK